MLKKEKVRDPVTPALFSILTDGSRVSHTELLAHTQMGTSETGNLSKITRWYTANILVMTLFYGSAKM